MKLAEKKSPKKKVNFLVTERRANAFEERARTIDVKADRRSGARTLLAEQALAIITEPSLDDLLEVAEYADSAEKSLGEYVAGLITKEAARIRKRTRS